MSSSGFETPLWARSSRTKGSRGQPATSEIIVIDSDSSNESDQSDQRNESIESDEFIPSRKSKLQPRPSFLPPQGAARVTFPTSKLSDRVLLEMVQEKAHSNPRHPVAPLVKDESSRRLPAVSSVPPQSASQESTDPWSSRPWRPLGILQPKPSIPVGEELRKRALPVDHYYGLPLRETMPLSSTAPSPVVKRETYPTPKPGSEEKTGSKRRQALDSTTSAAASRANARASAITPRPAKAIAQKGQTLLPRTPGTPSSGRGSTVPNPPSAGALRDPYTIISDSESDDPRPARSFAKINNANETARAPVGSTRAKDSNASLREVPAIPASVTGPGSPDPGRGRLASKAWQMKGKRGNVVNTDTDNEIPSAGRRPGPSVAVRAAISGKRLDHDEKEHEKKQSAQNKAASRHRNIDRKAWHRKRDLKRKQREAKVVS
ncbi:hypothetical protein F5Y19DRAFT_152062 [Xylariaceae sp. FL1651]|nr:hypothetical protein F5Y19DRAFT_152062 [Xylariaceae sp. FL1651]